jgi:hypothetical protein
MSTAFEAARKLPAAATSALTLACAAVTAVMPVWGKVFSGEGGRGKSGGAYSRRAVVELKRYLETIQKKAP